MRLARVDDRVRDELEAAREPIIRGAATIVFAGTLLFACVGLRGLESRSTVLAYVALFLLAGLTLWLTRRNLRRAGVLLSIGVAAVIAWASWNGVTSSPMTATAGLFVAILIAGSCWNVWSAFAVALVGSVSFGRLLYLDGHSLDAASIQLWAKISVVMLTMAGVVTWTLRALEHATRRAWLQERRVAAWVEGSPDGMLLLDTDRRIRMLNRAAESLLGDSASDVVGCRLDELRGLDAEAVAGLYGWMDAEPDTRPAQFEIFDEAREQVLEVSVSEVTGTHGPPERLLSLRDVTERHQTEQLRKAYENRVNESKSVEALGRLAAGVAHDFNNLLTVILATVDSLAVRFGDEGALARDLASIDDAAQRGASLAGQLLAFARKQVLRPEVLDLNAVVRDLWPLLQRLVPAEIALRSELTSGLGSVRVDSAQLGQVLMNLVANARDALPAGGRILVRTESCVFDPDSRETPVSVDLASDSQTAHGICLSVEDDGEGIPESLQREMFQPFVSTKGRGLSAGLGLATVEGVVRQSGGYVRVTSSPGQGACFFVVFPRHAERQEPSAAPSRATLDSRPADRLRILLVEDQADVRLAIEGLLDLMGHQVSVASNGIDAQTRFSACARSFDVLVTDISMPGVGGVELAKELLKLHPELRVLFLSGYVGDEETAVRGGEMLVPAARTRFLAKPFSRAALEASLRRLTEA